MFRVTDNYNIVIAFRYGLDTEHGFEVRLASNSIVAIGGIAET